MPFLPLQMANGAFCAVNGVWTNASDISRKYDVSNLTYGLNEVMQLRPAAYKYKTDGSRSIGFVAQEMEKIIPEVVSGEEGDKGIGYGLLTAVVVNAMQEQQEIILTQQSEIEALKTNSNQVEILLLKKKQELAEIKAKLEILTKSRTIE